MMVMKADLFQSLTDYSTRIQDLGDQIRSVPPAPGFDEVILPGDLEARAEETRGRDGIPIADALWERLEALAESLGVDID